MLRYKVSSKIRLLKVSAILCVLLLLILLTNLTIHQIGWNLFRYSTNQKGLTVKIDDQFAVSVEKIIRGDKALEIMEKTFILTDYPQLGYEYLLLKMKVTNTTKHSVYPYKYNFNLFYISDDNKKIYLENKYFFSPLYGDYKALNTTLSFLPGESWDTTLLYQVKKKFSPQFLEVKAFIPFLPYSIERLMSLEDVVLSNKDLFIICYWLALLLSLWAIWETYQQRKKRSDGISGYLAPVFIILFIPFITLLVITPFSVLSDRFLIGYFLVLTLVPFVFYFVAKKTYVAQFNWLSFGDMQNLIHEFMVRTELPETAMTIKKGIVKIKNPTTAEVYVFENNSVMIKNKTQDSKNPKKVLIDIYASSPFDWLAFYKTMFLIFFAFLAYFILISFLFTYYW